MQGILIRLKRLFHTGRISGKEPIRVRTSRDVRASIHPNGIVLLNISGGTVYTSNAVGARIWQGIEAQSTPEAIAARVSDEFDVPCDRALDDVARFIANLAGIGLLQSGD